MVRQLPQKELDMRRFIVVMGFVIAMVVVVVAVFKLCAPPPPAPKPVPPPKPSECRVRGLVTEVHRAFEQRLRIVVYDKSPHHFVDSTYNGYEVAVNDRVIVVCHLQADGDSAADSITVFGHVGP